MPGPRSLARRPSRRPVHGPADCSLPIDRPLGHAVLYRQEGEDLDGPSSASSRSGRQTDALGQWRDRSCGKGTIARGGRFVRRGIDQPRYPQETRTFPLGRYSSSPSVALSSVGSRSSRVGAGQHRSSRSSGPTDARTIMSATHSRGACTWLMRPKSGLRSGQARRMTSPRATTRGSSGTTRSSASSSGVQISTRSRSRPRRNVTRRRYRLDSVQANLAADA